MRFSLLVCLLLILTNQSLAGVVFEIETRDHSNGQPRTEQMTIYAEGAALRMETSAAQQQTGQAMIFRGDRREMMVVDHSRRSYLVIDQQFAAKMKGQMQQMAGQMQGMLDKVPAEQRAMMEQMMAGQGGQMASQQQAPTDVRSTGKQQQVYGYPCVLFTVSREGQKIRDVWVTNWNNIQGSRELIATFDSMSDFVGQLTAAFGAQANAPIADDAFATMKQMGGFPVATREYRPDGSVASESALRSAQVQRIDLAEFQAPNGYQPDSMFGGNAGLGQQPTNAGRYGQNRR